MGIRKQKKEKYERLKAEQEGSEPSKEVKIETDEELVDAIIMLPDYPHTKAECLALSQYGQSINCLFEVY